MINLLNDVMVNIFEISFFIEKIKIWDSVMGLFISHAHQFQIVLAHSLTTRVLEEHEFSFFTTPYPK